MLIEDLFDEDFYLKIYPEFARYIGQGKKYASAFDHFKNENGTKLDNDKEVIWYDPSAFFDTHYYLTAYPEVRQALATNQYRTPLHHFIAEGLKKNYNPSPFFDSNYYKNNSGVKIPDGQNAFEYFFLRDRKNPATSVYCANQDKSFQDYVLLWRRQVRDRCECFPYLLFADPSWDDSVSWELENHDFSKCTSAMERDVARYQAYQRLAKIKIDEKDLDKLKIEVEKINFNFKLKKSDWLVLKDDEVIRGNVKKLIMLDQLVDAGFDSATAIAGYSKKAFVNKASSALSWMKIIPVNLMAAGEEAYNLNLAQLNDITGRLYDAAKNIVAELSLHYLHSYQTLSPCVQGWAFQGTTSFDNDTSYPQLFGKLDYFNVDENNSIYSPGAYFFELMRITNDGELVKTDENSFRSLETRRPDLFEIPLDSTHTYQKHPYLRLVNYALGKQYLKNHQPPSDKNVQLKAQATYEDKMRNCENVVFSAIAPSLELFHRPFVLPIEQIRAELTSRQSSFYDIYSVFYARYLDKPDFNQYSIAREYLQLTQAEGRWLAQMNTLPTDFDLAEEVAIKDFYARTGLKQDQLKDLIPYDSELIDPEKHTAYQALYINVGGGEPIKKVVDYATRSEKIKNLTLDRLQRLSLFTFLVKKLGISNAEGQIVFSTLKLNDSITEENIKMMARIKWLCEQSKLPMTTLCYLLLPLPEFGPVYEDLINNPALLSQTHQENEKYPGQDTNLMTSLRNVINNQVSTSDSQVIQRVCISLNITPKALMQLVNKAMLDQCNQRYPQQLLNNLFIVNYLYRMVNTAKLLNVTIPEAIMLYHLIRGKEVTVNQPADLLFSFNDSLLVQASGNTLLSSANRLMTLLANALCLQQAKLSINTLYFIIYSKTSDIYRAQLEEKNGQFIEELKQQLEKYTGLPLLAIPAKDENPFQALVPPPSFQLLAPTPFQALVPPPPVPPALDKFICQKIASYFNVEFDLVTIILESIIPPSASSSEKKVIPHPIATYLHLNPADPQPSSSSVVTLFLNDAMNKINMLFQLVTLAQLLNLNFKANKQNAYCDVAILCQLITRRSGNEQLIDLEDIKLFIYLKQLQKAFKNDANDFLKYFNVQDKSTFLSLTQWDEQLFDQVMNKLEKGEAFPKQLPADSEIATLDFKLSIWQLLALQQAFDLMPKLGYDANLIFSLAALKDQDKVEYGQYDQLAQSLQALKLRGLNKATQNTSPNVSPQLEEQKRNILIHHLLQPTRQDLLNNQFNKDLILSNNWKTIKSADDLSQYLLLDTQMTSCDLTTPIAQGIASVQLYLQRCRLGIEDGVKLGIPDIWWPWLENFRLWEANRKVLLHPENYLEPDLRIEQSAEFKQLVQGFLQGNLDTDTVDKSFRNYFHQITTLSNLIYTAACAGKKAGDDQVNVIYLFAHTRNSPYQYYIRTAEYIGNLDNLNNLQWSYWNKMEVSINVGLIRPLYAFNRLFVFFVEPKVTSHKDAKVEGHDVKERENNINLLSFKIKCTYQNSNGAWENPQVLDEEEQYPLNDFIIKDSASLKNPKVVVKNGVVQLVEKNTSEAVDAKLNVFNYLLNQLNVTQHDNNVIELRYFEKKITIDKYLTVTSGQEIGKGIMVYPYDAGNNKIYPYDSSRNYEFDLYRSEEKDTHLYSFIPAPSNLLLSSGSDFDKHLDFILIPPLELPPRDKIKKGIGPQYPLMVGEFLVNDHGMIAGFDKSNVFVVRYQENIIWHHTNWPGKPGSKASKDTNMARVSDNGYFEIWQPGTPNWMSNFDMPPLCDFLLVSSPPQKGAFDSLPMTSNVVYIRVKSQLQEEVLDDKNFFFVNKTSKKFINLNLSGDNLRDIDQYVKVQDLQIGRPRRLTGDEINKINSVTGNNWTDYYHGISKNAYFKLENNGQLSFIDNNAPYLQTTSPLTSQKLVTTSPRADLILGEGMSNVTLLNNLDETYLILQQSPTDWTGKWPDNWYEKWPTTWQFTRLSSTASIHNLNATLLIGGFSGLYHRVNQDLEHDFSSLQPSLNVIGPTTRKLDFTGGFANYYWEIFFHAPFYIANQLNAKQRFAEARDWYHYIFNPHGPATENKFKFPPFQSIDPKENLLTDQKILQIYRDHMFDPHAIAALRPIAYMKAVVMKYIKNLIDWGDYEFALNTRESITQATNLYLMARDLLGDKPQALGYPERTVNIISFQDYQSDRVALSEITANIFKVFENNLASYATSSIPDKFLNDINPYFSLPENKEFIAYWDRIADRLFKIHHCQNIEGVMEKLDLFSPELDVEQLIRLAATSGGVDITEMLNLPPPIYRFRLLVERAKEMTQQLIQLGSELLAALERQDHESLALLSTNQQMSVLNLIDQIKQKQIEESQAVLDQALSNIQTIENRKDYYTDLVKTGLSTEETVAMGLKIASQALYFASNIANTESSFLFAIPQFQVGFAAIGPYATVSLGGMQLGFVAQAVANGLQTAGNLLGFAAEDMLTVANYNRRAQEWRQQQQQAEKELAAANKQLKVNQIQVEIVKRDYSNHQELIKQQQELLQYYQSKFTNLDLYQWYVDQLVALYRQAYETALSTAKTAERAYDYELNNKKVFVTNSHYSFFRKGLLAGQALMGEIMNMEKSYLENNKRLFEIEKTISLKALFKEMSDEKNKEKSEEECKEKNKEFRFDANGEMTFCLPKTLFDRDFDHHCNRRIKRISVTVPSLAKPYQNINFILTKTSGSRVGEQIVLSTGVNDTGMFEPNLQDSRYLPFEGTEVENSSWTLSIGNKDNSNSISISDVIIRLEYTAEIDLKNSAPIKR
jgi:hypothetical protein